MGREQVLLGAALLNAPSEHLTVFVNDTPNELPPDASLATLLEGLRLSTRTGIAVAVNDEVVPRSAWSERGLRNQDRVLILAASQGG